MQSGIYSITNKTDGKIYIGSGVNIAERWRSHRKLLKGKRHTNIHLQNAWDAHGADAFEFAVILLCDRGEVLKHEQAALDALFAERKRGDIYNVARCATAPTKGLPVSAETRAKRSAALKGLKRSEEAKANMSAAQKGRTISHETRQRISAATSGEKHRMWGREVSEATKAKLREINTGRLVSEETKRRISESKCGEKHPCYGKNIPADVIAKRVASRLANKLRRLNNGE